MSQELAFDGHQITDEQIRSLQSRTDVTALVIWGGPLTDGRLKPLSDLIWLKGLVLGEMMIEDSLFEHLKPLRNLEYLNLAYTNIQGDFTRLSGLPLRDVRLEGCRRVGDACAKTLATFPTLRQLEIHMTGLTDDGLQHFQNSDLEVLWLGPRITDNGMKTVGTMRRLKHLDVCAHLVTDEGVRELATLPDLEVLWLTRCRVSDDIIPLLADRKNLRELNVRHTEVTEQGIERLRQALPNCRIVDAD
jgi:internalin A